MQRIPDSLRSFGFTLVSNHSVGTRALHSGAIELPLKKILKFGRLIAALVCLQFFVLMTAEAAHAHHPDAFHTDHCLLCATAHIPLAAKPVQLPARSSGCILELAMGETSRGARFVSLTTFIRPPPLSVLSK